MNVALRLLMRGPSAAANNGSPIRTKLVTQNTGTSITATFDEATALGSTYLLVALAMGQVVGPSTPSGWTAASGGGNYGFAYQGAYAKQGDGSTNSVTVSFGGSLSNWGAVMLLAFPGYVSATALTTGSGTDNVNVGSKSIPAPGTLPSATNGVILNHIASVGAMQVTRTVSNGYTLLPPLGSHANAGETQFMAAWKQYTGSGGSYATVFDWGGNTSYERYQSIAYQLT